MVGTFGFVVGTADITGFAWFVALVFFLDLLLGPGMVVVGSVDLALESQLLS